jgi:Holliday junction resolvasome RuvABC endonuclease subunit
VRVIGLDLSLASTGVAEISTVGAVAGVHVHRIKSKTNGAASLPERGRRLRSIVRGISDFITHESDDHDELIVVEGPSYGQARQGGQHDRAGLWWLVVEEVTSLGYNVCEVPPTIVKKYATGAGNATKDAVMLAVARRYPNVPVTGNDEADALVLAAMGARHLGHPIDSLPQVHLQAMTKVHWPTPIEGASTL